MMPSEARPTGPVAKPFLIFDLLVRVHMVVRPSALA
jgi:hypothetical protein